jgi:hypothetical protein
LTLEETDDFLTTPAIIAVKEQVQNVSLSTMDGKKLSDNVEFRKCLSYSPSDCRDTDQTDTEGKYNNIFIAIDKPGRYIATVRFAGGEEVRYGIEAVSSAPHFYYSLRILEEKPTASVDLGAKYTIGKHILPKGAEQIAVITRDTGTNLFHAAGKKTGSFDIKLPDHNKTDLINIGVHVQELGPIIHVEIYESIDTHM